jgi:tRNA pseudouridine32 synthase/23S rRNA pseudouridine746 synthase
MSIQFTILKDTSSLLVVNKPPNIAFHNSGDTSLGAVTLLRQQLGPNYPRIYPVHRLASFFSSLIITYSAPPFQSIAIRVTRRLSNRPSLALSLIFYRLDAMTSGVMMFAKSPEIVREIIEKFRAKQISKYYVAISARKPAKKMGTVIGDMTRGRRGSWMLQRTVEKSPAITRFIASAVPGRPGKIAFLLRPESGKTHQLRVALKSLGSPVLGDIRYGNALDAKKESRGYLHCAALRLYIGNTLHQVVCPPWHTAVVLPSPPSTPPPQPSKNEEDTVAVDNVIDSEFTSSEFRQFFEEKWFPPGIEDTMGVWFPENKLLRSSPESLK